MSSVHSSPGPSDVFVPRLPSSLLTVNDPHHHLHHQSPRTVSITMEDYIADDKDDHLNMDMVHDFGGGEGLGVDMRDFTNDHSGDENDQVKDELLGHEHNSTPLSHDLSPQPPTSALGDVPSSSAGIDMFQAESGLGDDDDDDEAGPGESSTTNKRPRTTSSGSGFQQYIDKDGETQKRKIKIEYIGDKSRRHITFSKRKAGIMKKAYELSILTGTQVLLLVVSETGLVYTFTTNKLQPLVQKSEGKSLIQACLNAPEGFGPDGEALNGPVPTTKAKNGGLAIRPHKLTPAATAAMAASAQAASTFTQPVGGSPMPQPHMMHQPLPPHSHPHQQQQHPGPHPQTTLQPPTPTPHQQQQVDAVSALGVGAGLGSPNNRPKKRLPSGKRRQLSMSGGQPSDIQTDMGDIPPVPPIPDAHRATTPHRAGGPNAGGNGVNGAMQSPMSAGFHMPAEYHRHPSTPGAPPQPQHQAAPQQYFHPAPGAAQDGSYGYFSSPQGPPHGGGGHQGPMMGFAPQGHHQPQQQQAMFQQQHQQVQQQQRERERLMGMGI